MATSAEIDARRDANHKRCKGCKYYDKMYNLNLWYCSYALREDRLRKRNPVTGECESFTPKSHEKQTEKERIEKSRKSILKAEADTVNKRFRE